MVDACLVRFKRPEMVVDVKWKGVVTKEDIANAEKNLGRTGAKERFMFVQEKKGLKSDGLEFLDVSDL